MEDRTIAIIIIIAVAAYLLYTNRSKVSGSSQNYTVPSNLKGSQGLDYIKNNYASGLSQAKSLCITQFKGNWMDNSNTIGCYNMQGFSTFYCNTDTIRNLVNLCNSIGGNSVCSSTQASCSV